MEYKINNLIDNILSKKEYKLDEYKILILDLNILEKFIKKHRNFINFCYPSKIKKIEIEIKETQKIIRGYSNNYKYYIKENNILCFEAIKEHIFYELIIVKKLYHLLFKEWNDIDNEISKMTF
jgi:hypothetical protein